MNFKSIDNPVFIIGSGRSGTTMLRLILDSTKEVAIGPETDIIWSTLKDIPEVFWSYFKSPQYIIRRRTFINRELRDYGFDLNQFKTFIDKSKCRKQFLDLFFGTYAFKKNKPRWGDNTPMNLIVIPKILKLYPNSQFIHIFRNPKAVVYSYLRKDFGPNNVKDCAKLWLFRTKYIFELCRNQNISRRIKHIKYEDFLSNPAKELSNILSFLSIRESSKYLLENFYKNSHDGVYGEGFLSPIDRNRASHYDYSEKDELVIEKICGHMMKNLNYELKYIELDFGSDNDYRLKLKYYNWLLHNFLINPAKRIL